MKPNKIQAMKHKKEDAKLTEELNNAVDTSTLRLGWNPDSLGYFTIKPFSKLMKVFVRHYDTNHKLRRTYSGISTAQIIHRVIEDKLVSKLNHSAYLGKEIEKAVIALNHNLDYVQDEDLKISK